MKKDISYKTLIIGSAVYILCGLVINYLFGVGDVLSEQAIGEKNRRCYSGTIFFFIYFLYTVGTHLLFMPSFSI